MTFRRGLSLEPALTSPELSLWSSQARSEAVAKGPSRALKQRTNQQLDLARLLDEVAKAIQKDHFQNQAR